MNQSLAICIPTSSRPEQLVLVLKNLGNLFASKKRKFPVFVSVNRSTGSDELQYKQISLDSFDFPLQFEFRSKAVRADENMAAAVSLCTEEYIWFLGDDDIALAAGFNILLELLNQQFDLLVFHPAVKIRGPVSSQKAQEIFSKAAIAFKKLHDKCTFGSVVVRRKHLAEMGNYLGTFHSYCSFWEPMSFLETSKTFYIRQPLVFSLPVAKTYNDRILEVYRLSIPQFYQILASRSAHGTSVLSKLELERANANSQKTTIKARQMWRMPLRACRKKLGIVQLIIIVLLKGANLLYFELIEKQKTKRTIHAINEGRTV
jgi:hypothetical protein